VTNGFHVLRPCVIIDDMGMREIDLSGYPEGVVEPDPPHAAAVGKASLDQRISAIGKRFERRMGDFTGQPEATRWIAGRAGIAMHKDPVKNRSFEAMNPVFFPLVFSPYP
jgi:hypothetical protein